MTRVLEHDAGDRERQCPSLKFGQTWRCGAVVRVDKLSKSPSAVSNWHLSGKSAARVRVVEDEGEIVDAVPCSHEVEIKDRNDPIAQKEHVVVPEVAVDDLTR